MSEDSQSKPTDSLLDSALFYASLGWRVFPTHAVINGRCTCGDQDCPSPGKHPRIAGGLNSATTDQDQIRWWWSKWPDANVAIQTGHISRLVVLDIDPRNGGDISLESIEKFIPDTVVQLTGGGGTHFLFAYPPGDVRVKSRGNILPGIDIKADGGYIIASPSTHISGGTYEFEASSEPSEEFMPVLVPDGIVEMLDLYTDDENIELQASEDHPFSELERNKIADALRYITPDDRDDWLRVGMAIHHENGGDDAFDIWNEWSQTTKSGNYNARSQVTVWRSFKHKKRQVTIDTLFHDARKNGWVFQPQEELKFVLDADEEESRTIENHSWGYKANETVNSWGGMRSFGELNASNVDRRECWWRGTTIRERAKTIIVGMPKAKKTFFVLGMGMAAASGSTFAGITKEYKFPRPIKTFWFQGEMQDDDTFERFQMMTKEMPTDQVDLIKQNFLFSDALRWDLMNPNHFIRMEYEIVKHKPELIFFDPFSKFNQVNENDNGEMLELLDRFDCLIRKYRVSVVLVHHTGKGARSKIQNNIENPFDVMRGASALLGWMEAGLIIGPGADKDSLRVIYEHRAQRVPEPHGMRLEFSEDGTSAKWALCVDQLEDGSYSALIDDSSETSNERVAYAVDQLKQSEGMTSGALRAKLMKVFKIKERAAEKVISELYEHPFVTVTGQSRSRLFHHISSVEEGLN